jgi:hypothetical protein
MICFNLAPNKIEVAIYIPLAARGFYALKVAPKIERIGEIAT